MRWGATLGFTWVMAWVGTLAGRAHWEESFLQSAEAVTSAILVVWPLALGVGAAQGVRLRRIGAIDHTRSWPGAGATRLVVGRLLQTWLLGCMGGVVALLGAWLAAAWHGSPPSWQPLSGFVLALAGLLPTLVLGGALGALTNSYVVAAAAIIVGYVTPWQLALLGVTYPVGFAGVTATIGDAVMLAADVVMSYLFMFAALFVLVLSALVVIVDGRTVGPQGMIVVACAGVLAAVTYGLTAISIEHRLDGPGAWVDQGPSAWDCRPIEKQISVACLPRDLAAYQDRYMVAVDRLDRYIRSVATEQPPPFLYARSIEAWPSRSPDTVLIVMETDLAQPEQRWAAHVATFLTDNPQLIGVDPPSTSGCLGDMASLDALLSAVASGAEPPGDGLSTAVRQALTC